MMLPGRTSKIEPFAIDHATICTGDVDGTTLSDMSVVVNEGGRIETLAPSDTIGIPAHYHRIDATGKYVAPGLINAHVHLFSDGRPLDPDRATPRAQKRLKSLLSTPGGRAVATSKARTNLTTLLRSGVTTVRTLGDIGYEAVALRRKVESGALLGPRILASGPMLAVPEGHGAPLVALTGEGPDESRRNAETNIDHGVNVLKIAATGGITDAQEPGEAGRPQMDVASMRAICDVAHADDMIVAAHAQSPEGVRAALEAGVDTIEHGAHLNEETLELFADNPHALRGYSALIPTMSAGLALTALPQELTGINDIQAASAKEITDGMIAGARDAHMHGVKVGVGTDSGMTFVTQYSTWRELYLLAHYAGFSAAEAFHAATQGNAEILGISRETGSITVGKSADLLVLDDDPARDLRTLASPKLVVTAGRPVWRPHVRHIESIDAPLDTKL